jgi:transposase
LQQLLAQGLSLAEIGRRFGRHESTVAYWVEKHGLQAANRDENRARGGLSKTELERMVRAGYSIAEIAAQLDRGKATVRHWLKKYNLKTDRAVGKMRSSASRAAHDAGIARPSMVCAHHGQTTFALDGRGYYRCVQCRSGAVSRRRRKMKEILVHDAGGACRLCGYRR